MKEAEALRLREVWSQQGNPSCLHLRMVPERGFAGLRTGFHVCVQCGWRDPTGSIDSQELNG